MVSKSGAALHSFWRLICGSPYGVMVKKLERLAGIKALALEQDRSVHDDAGLEGCSFLVRHQARSWPELTLELLGVAQRIHPAWKITLGPDSVAAELARKQDNPKVEHLMPIAGLYLLSWEINAAADYRRAAVVAERRKAPPLPAPSKPLAPAAMEMIEVDSSAITAVGYDPATRHMRIRFKEGHAYDFCGVPKPIFDGLLRAESKGSYYAAHIRGRYPC